MTIVEGLTIAGLFSGPLAAVVITLVIEARREDRMAKTSVMRTLMLARINFADPAFQAAINSVPIVFKRNDMVLTAWERYLVAVNKRPTEDNVVQAVMQTETNAAHLSLCKAVLLALGYPERDVDRIAASPYASSAFVNSQQLQTQALMAIIDISEAVKKNADAATALLALAQHRVPTGGGSS